MPTVPAMSARICPARAGAFSPAFPRRSMNWTPPHDRATSCPEGVVCGLNAGVNHAVAGGIPGVSLTAWPGFFIAVTSCNQRSEFIEPPGGRQSDAAFYQKPSARCSPPRTRSPSPCRCSTSPPTSARHWLPQGHDGGPLGRQGVRLFDVEPVRSVVTAQLPAFAKLEEHPSARACRSSRCAGCCRRCRACCRCCSASATGCSRWMPCSSRVSRPRCSAPGSTRRAPSPRTCAGRRGLGGAGAVTGAGACVGKGGGALRVRGLVIDCPSPRQWTILQYVARARSFSAPFRGAACGTKTDLWHLRGGGGFRYRQNSV
ncbi:MAG: hypothetical protein MZU95_10505 [Desulfomicrobium escambiense]|nr:hypothetical protein [Desulfomicrobium escambiense]